MSRAFLNELLKLMLERKKTHFAGIDRLILDHDIVKTPQGLHLNVVSSVS